jgi:hypothetical protein
LIWSSLELSSTAFASSTLATCERLVEARTLTGIAMTDENKSSGPLPEAPELGPPASYFHGIWVDAPEEEAVEWYDELDALRWSIRCVRKFAMAR